jgi:hypothetical protein
MPGPYIALAVFCEKVLQEADGVLSLIRVVDRVQVTASGTGDLPDELPLQQIPMTLVVSLRSGDARGRHPIHLDVELPSGQTLERRSVDVMFEGEDRGANVILNIGLEAQEGVYWIAISCHDQELTRVPLRVIYQRIPGAPG